MKTQRKSVIAMWLASASLLCAPAAFARVDVHVEVGVPPPVAVVETVPAPRSGYVYAPGYWAWNGDRHVWIRGRAIAERPGYYWVADRWEPVGGRHRFVPGYWAPAKEGRGHGKGHGKGWAKGHNKD